MRALALVGLTAVAVGNTACWEQWSPSWFPQMKRQPAGQAFEDTGVPGHPQGFTPPDGTLPTDGLATPATTVVDDGSGLLTTIPDDVADGLSNPVPADLRSLTDGKRQYEIYCATCHGQKGMADGPVAKVFLGVLPLVVSQGRTDGHLYATISYGRRRMPAYSRLTLQDRWDIVNYVRYLFPKPGQNVATVAPGGGQP